MVEKLAIGSWSDIIHCPIQENFKVNTKELYKVPNEPGIYVIGSIFFNRFQPHYIGRSKRMRKRLKDHLYEYKTGSKQILAVIDDIRRRPNTPFNGFYVRYLKTNDHRIVEALFIKEIDPLLNIQGVRDLPEGVTHEMILKSELDNQKSESFLNLMNFLKMLSNK